jgi:hypothetical protein
MSTITSVAPASTVRSEIAEISQTFKALTVTQRELGKEDLSTLVEVQGLSLATTQFFDKMSKQFATLQDMVVNSESQMLEAARVHKEELALRERQIADLQKQNAEMRQEMLKTAKQTETLIADLIAARKQDLDTYTKAVEGQIAPLKLEVAKLQNENETLRQQNAQQEHVAKTIVDSALEAARAKTGADVAAIRQEYKGLEGRVGNVEGRTGGVEKRIGEVEARTCAVEKRVGGVEARVGGVEGRVASHPHPVSCSLERVRVPGGTRGQLVVTVAGVRGTMWAW